MEVCCIHPRQWFISIYLPGCCSLLPKSTCLPASPPASSPSTTSLRASSILFVFSSPDCHHVGSVTPCWLQHLPWGQVCPFAPPVLQLLLSLQLFLGFNHPSQGGVRGASLPETW